MSKKNLFLFLTLAILSGVYLYFFTELFNRPTIGISEGRPRVERNSRGGTDRYTMSFSFDTKCKLTEVKVVSIAALETNKYALPAWHMIADTNSAPVKGLTYGDKIKGMKPSIPKMQPEPLEPGGKYRLFIQAGKRKGERDFQVPAQKRASL